MRVAFPGGVIIQARGSSSRISTEGDGLPDWGLYLDKSWTERVAWPHRLIDWPDYGVPAEEDEQDAFDAVMEAWHRASRGQCVEVACGGGTGRTGTVLACMAVLAGLAPTEAIRWVRSWYHREAIETEAQERLIMRFASEVQPPAASQAGDPSLPSSSEVGGVGRDVIALRNRLLSDLDRWEPELKHWRGTRGTLWYGIFDKACKGVEQLLVAVTANLLIRANDAGRELLKRIASGKPVERFTLGQHLDLLRVMDRRRLLLPGRRLLEKSDLQVLERVVDRRNDFEHGRLEYDERAIEKTLTFLGDVRAFCRSPIVELARETGADNGGPPFHK